MYCRREDRAPNLRRFEKEPNAGQLDPDWLPRIRRVLTLLDQATGPQHLAVPSYGRHPLKGRLRGHRNVPVSANWRIVFRFEDGEAVDVRLIDYH